jgi:hypothetical protein
MIVVKGSGAYCHSIKKPIDAETVTLMYKNSPNSIYSLGPSYEVVTMYHGFIVFRLHINGNYAATRLMQHNFYMPVELAGLSMGSEVGDRIFK